MQWADCGGNYFETPQRRLLDLNVFVREVANGTSVTVNVHVQEVRTSALNRMVTDTVECSSVGALEKGILDVASGSPNPIS